MMTSGPVGEGGGGGEREREREKREKNLITSGWSYLAEHSFSKGK
jgi:hypothetical protein